MDSTFTVAVLAGALIYTLTNFASFLVNGDWPPVIKQAISWIVGILVSWALSNTQWATDPHLNLLGVQLSDANAWEVIIFGMMASSLFAPIYNLFKAVDHTQTAAVPAIPWVGGGDTTTTETPTPTTQPDT